MSALNGDEHRSLVFSILKVLVMLTMKPTKESTNISQQFKYLRAYKYAFLSHDIVPILMTILVDPLSRQGTARTAQVISAHVRSCAGIGVVTLT